MIGPPKTAFSGAIAGAPRLPTARRPLGSRYMRRSRGGKKHPAAGRPPRVARRHGGHGGHGECYGGTPRRPRRRQTPQRPRRLLLQRLLLRRPRRLQARRSRRLRARRRPLPRRYHHHSSDGDRRAYIGCYAVAPPTISSHHITTSLLRLLPVRLLRALLQQQQLPGPPVPPSPRFAPA